jgi:hypothetical protein
MERHKLLLLKTAGTIWKQARCSSAHIHEVSKTLSFVFFFGQLAAVRKRYGELSGCAVSLPAFPGLS